MQNKDFGSLFDEQATVSLLEYMFFLRSGKKTPGHVYDREFDIIGCWEKIVCAEYRYSRN